MKLKSLSTDIATELAFIDRVEVAIDSEVAISKGLLKSKTRQKGLQNNSGPMLSINALVSRVKWLPAGLYKVKRSKLKLS